MGKYSPASAFGMYPGRPVAYGSGVLLDINTNLSCMICKRGYWTDSLTAPYFLRLYKKHLLRQRIAEFNAAYRQALAV